MMAFGAFYHHTLIPGSSEIVHFHGGSTLFITQIQASETRGLLGASDMIATVQVVAGHVEASLFGHLTRDPKSRALPMGL